MTVSLADGAEIELSADYCYAKAADHLSALPVSIYGSMEQAKAWRELGDAVFRAEHFTCSRTRALLMREKSSDFLSLCRQESAAHV